MVIFKWLRYYQIPKQSQLVYLIDFDQLLMLIKSSETHAIFIILAVLVLKRVQRVLPKLHAKRTIIRTLTVTYGTLQKKQKVLRVKFTKTKASVSVFVFLILYAHIRYLRHAKRAVQACRERVFTFSIKFLWRVTILLMTRMLYMLTKISSPLSRL